MQMSLGHMVICSPIIFPWSSELFCSTRAFPWCYTSNFFFLRTWAASIYVVRLIRLNSQGAPVLSCALWTEVRIFKMIKMGATLLPRKFPPDIWWEREWMNHCCNWRHLTWELERTLVLLLVELREEGNFCLREMGWWPETALTMCYSLMTQRILNQLGSPGSSAETASSIRTHRSADIKLRTQEFGYQILQKLLCVQEQGRYDS